MCRPFHTLLLLSCLTGLSLGRGAVEYVFPMLPPTVMINRADLLRGHPHAGYLPAHSRQGNWQAALPRKCGSAICGKNENPRTGKADKKAMLPFFVAHAPKSAAHPANPYRHIYLLQNFQ